LQIYDDGRAEELKETAVEAKQPNCPKVMKFLKKFDIEIDYR